MLRPSALGSLLLLYSSLSRHGRRGLREFQGRATNSQRTARHALLNDPVRRATLFRSLRACDRCYRAWVPDGLCRRLGRRPYDNYRRFVAFAWLNVEIRSRVLHAFGLPCDRAAAERLALLSMMTREWNDLQDRFPNSLLLRILSGDEPNPPDDCRLVARLVHACNTWIPTDRFPRFHEFMRAAPRIAGRPFTPETARERLAEKSHAATMAALHAACNDIPEPAAEALRPFSLWFYELDDYADLHRDQEAGRPTLLTPLAAPAAELQASLAAAAASLRASARDPERLLSMMEFLTRRVLDARAQGTDLEREVFFAAPTPA
jgi:hypothetical protein